MVDSSNVNYCHLTDYSTFFRISLLAYSPLAMGILSGKYFSPEGGPGDARLNLYKGSYKMLPHIFLFLILNGKETVTN